MNKMFFIASDEILLQKNVQPTLEYQIGMIGSCPLTCCGDLINYKCVSDEPLKHK